MEFSIGQGRLFILEKDSSKVPDISNTVKALLKDGTLTTLNMDFSQSMYNVSPLNITFSYVFL